ncbi:MAG: DNA-binding protein WhiA [Clostridia bacterium]|nr:DNA-binding protein WhiA [Clostridia bacterium]
MNFTQEIKRDLIKYFPKDRDSKSALLAAVLDTSGNFRFGEGNTLINFTFTIESEESAEYLLGVFEQLFPGERMTVSQIVLDPKRGKNKLTVSYTGARAAELTDAIRGYEEGDEADIYYLRGAFLSGGSCTLPKEGKKTGYHLEVVFEDQSKATFFLELLERFQLIGSIVRRGDKQVGYLKSREAISDFLSVIEARRALRTLEKISATREENNQENRVGNCMAGNADKTAIASAAQTVAFKRLKREGVLSALEASLKEVAEARLENPTLSLVELAEKLNITKSCLNHRIRKLMQLYIKTVS